MSRNSGTEGFEVGEGFELKKGGVKIIM